MSDLINTAQALVAPDKGILAADESVGTMDKRLSAAGIPADHEHRAAFREVIATTPELGKWISGVILADETVRQQVGDRPLPLVMRDGSMIPGIKVDKGAKAMAAAAAGETVTEGLDGLRERLAEYGTLGARFAKWRAVIHINDEAPTERCVAANAHALARYAALCQEAGIVPIVEPEVLMDGAHTLQRCEEATTRALRAVFAALAEQHVLLEGIVLKPNMVVAGKDCPEQPGVDDVADATLRTLHRTVPAAVPGIAFLSGGQTDEAATVHLDAINRRMPQPWELTFSYGRGLLAAALTEWNGQRDNTSRAHGALAERARDNALARAGRYERAVATAR